MRLGREQLKRRATETVIVVTIALIGSLLVLLTHAQTDTASLEAEAGTLNGKAVSVKDAKASGGEAVKFTSGDKCTISPILVNSCRPWLGGHAAHYPPPVVANLTGQTLDHEKRIGRQLDVVRGNYHNFDDPLITGEQAFATRPNTLLFISWKPAATFQEAADSSNATTNLAIDHMAASIKALGSHKIFLTLWHEPQLEVTAGSVPGCSSGAYRSGATGGTPAQYRAMWANVENRFKADGVTNVVWSIVYLGGPKATCMIDDLWPGNNLIDWVDFDRYGSKNYDTWQSTVGTTYRFLTSASDAAHDYLSKPWGVAEFSISNVDQPTAYKYWDSIKQALDANTFPKIKLYMVYDSAGGPGGAPTPAGDNRVEYGLNGFDPIEQQHYNGFADDPRFTDAFYQ
ncbi:MAG TPA: hypothetical protein VFH39_00175 [Candidatus Saccharimonadales bacterium]|nr:hypothetical protein [Candidatus Saccharimonadales bacterium]